MKSIAVKVALISAVLGAAVFALVGTANASHVKVEVAAPSQASIGRSVEVQVTLHSASDGSAIADAPVVFYTEGSFGDITGDVELGRAMTDQNGVAILNYQPRAAGEHQIRAEYLTPGESEPEVATTGISVVGTSQLYRSTAGIHVPGLNVWLLIAVVTAVWAILFSVALRVVAIARAGADVETVSERAPRPKGADRRVAAPEASASEA